MNEAHIENCSDSLIHPSALRILQIGAYVIYFRLRIQKFFTDAV
jgi:hypothetical protein